MDGVSFLQHPSENNLFLYFCHGESDILHIGVHEVPKTSINDYCLWLDGECYSATILGSWHYGRRVVGLAPTSGAAPQLFRGCGSLTDTTDY